MRVIYIELSDAAYEIIKPQVLSLIEPYRKEGTARWFPEVADDEFADSPVKDDPRRVE